MAESTKTRPLSALINELWGEYAEWHGQVLRRVYYYAQLSAPSFPELSLAFEDRIRAHEDARALNPVLIDTIRETQAAMIASAQKLYSFAEKGIVPLLEDFDDFNNIYEDFSLKLHRIEQDSKLTDSGLDKDTGMRSMTVFSRDMEREMERRSRSEIAFCLAVLRLDGLEDIEKSGESVLNSAAKGAAKAILTCMRTYDDAYRKEGGEFILCLKNTDLTGAGAALARINKYLQREAITFKGASGVKPVTLSSSVSEVLPGENVDQKVKDLSTDIEKAKGQPGTVLQLKEMSQLQRYIKGMSSN